MQCTRLNIDNIKWDMSFWHVLTFIILCTPNTANFPLWAVTYSVSNNGLLIHLTSVSHDQTFYWHNFLPLLLAVLTFNKSVCQVEEVHSKPPFTILMHNNKTKIQNMQDKLIPTNVYIVESYIASIIKLFMRIPTNKQFLL